MAQGKIRGKIRVVGGIEMSENFNPDIHVCPCEDENFNPDIHVCHCGKYSQEESK